MADYSVREIESDIQAAKNALEKALRGLGKAGDESHPEELARIKTLGSQVADLGLGISQLTVNLGFSRAFSA